MSGRREWVRSGNVFVTRDQEIPYWRLGIISRLEVLHSLEEYKLFVQALQTEPLSARIGRILTAVGAGGMVSIEELADHLLWAMVRHWGRFVFDAGAFDTLFAEFGRRPET